MAVKMAKDGNALVLLIEEALEDYSEEVQEAVTKEAKEVAKLTVEKLKETSPKATGEYAKGWTQKKQDKGYVVYNKTKPSVTHLLEFPHRHRDGTMSRPQPHIKPAEEFAAEEYAKRIKDKLERG